MAGRNLFLLPHWANLFFGTTLDLTQRNVSCTSAHVQRASNHILLVH